MTLQLPQVVLPQSLLAQGREPLVRWWWNRGKHLNQRVADAQTELDTSRRLHADEQKTIQPLKAAEVHNQFVEIIRDAIVGDDYRN